MRQGCSTFSYIAAASANQDSQLICAGASYMRGFECFNNVATVRFVKLYNKATAPTSADTPVRRILVPGNSGGAGVGAGVVRELMTAQLFPLGLGIRITTGMADSDANAATAADVCLNIDYN